MAIFTDLSISSPSPTPPAPETPNLNREHPFNHAIHTYPFLAGLSRHLDRTDLHNLATTCHAFYSVLRDYRSTLLTLSLRCSLYARTKAFPSEDEEREESWRDHRNSQRCAKDLVQPCVRCLYPICRNCVQKPHPTHLTPRFRRLCAPCQRSPTLLPPPSLPPYDAIKQVCTCTTAPWICPPCSKEVATEDNAYRLWCEMWVGEFSRDTRRMVRGHDGRMHCPDDGWFRGGRVGDGNGESVGGREWGPVCCPRGEDCKGLQLLHVQGVSWRAEPTPTEEHQGITWEEFGDEMEAEGEVSWRKQASARGLRRGGREVEFEGRGWALVREWQGEVRAWCNWCDKVVLSKLDKERTGLDC